MKVFPPQITHYVAHRGYFSNIDKYTIISTYELIASYFKCQSNINLERLTEQMIIRILNIY